MSSNQSSQNSSLGWQQTEYTELAQLLSTEDSVGVILEGSIGSGKSQMVQSMLERESFSYVVVRIICSPVIAETSYGALAPLLSDLDGEINDAAAIRESLRAVHRRLANEPTATAMLILVEDGEFLDSASAFVLTQILRVSPAKLLVLRNTTHQDSIAAELLASVDQVQRIRIEPLTLEEIQSYGSGFFGRYLSSGAAESIYIQTRGLFTLVHEYLQLAVRQDAIVSGDDAVTLNTAAITCDQRASAVLYSLVKRHGTKFVELVETLALLTELPVTMAQELGFSQLGEELTSRLIVQDNDKARLAGSFMSQAAKLWLSPGKTHSYFERFRNVANSGSLTNPEFVAWALNRREEISPGRVLAAVQQLIKCHDYLAAAQLLDASKALDSHLWRVENLQVLLGLNRLHGALAYLGKIAPPHEANQNLLYQIGLTALNWLQKPNSLLTGDHADEPPNIVTEDEAGSALRSTGYPADAQAVRQCVRALRLLLAGDLQEIHPQQSLAANEELAFLLPPIRYRLSLLTVQVRALLDQSKYGHARQKLDSFQLHDVYEVRQASGTVQILRALTELRAGNISRARSSLRNAEIELLLLDPQELIPLCQVIRFSIGGESVDHDKRESNGTDSRMGKTPLTYDMATKLVNDRNGFGDVPVQELLAALQVKQPFNELVIRVERLRTSVPETVFVTALFDIWTHTVDAELSEYLAKHIADIRVPEDCIRLHRIQRIIQFCQSPEPDSMSDYAHRLMALGESVLALLLMCQVVSYWSEHGEPRLRGAALRKIYEWLELTSQDPWGLINHTLNLVGLTHREKEIVELVRSGLSNREIARHLTVSQRTVEGHLYRLFAKLGITQRAELFPTDQ